jgi:teichuronic acid exporter
MSNIRSALKHSFLGNYAIIAVQFFSSLIIARLLTPDEFGVYSVALVFATLSELMKDFGVTNYIIKEKELSNEKLESSLSLLVIFALIIALLMLLLSFPIGSFYQSDELVTIIQILTINIVISPFGTIPNALLLRGMKIKAVNVIYLISSILGTGLTLILAYSDIGVLSLAIGHVATSVFKIIGFQFLSFELKAKKLGVSKIKEIFGYASYAAGTNIIAHFGNSSQDWILAKALGMEAVGTYARGTSTVDLYDKAFSNAINKILMPIFAQKHHDKDSLSAAYVKLLSIQSTLAWPILAAMAIFAEPLVSILYGDQWGLVAQLIPWMCAGKMMVIITQPTNSLMLATGRSKELLKATVTLHITRILLIVSTMEHNLVTIVAVASLGTQFVRLFLFGYLLKRYIRIDFFHLFNKLRLPFLVFLLTMIPVYFSSIQSQLTSVLISLFFSFVVWITLIFIFKLDISQELKRLLKPYFPTED